MLDAGTAACRSAAALVHVAAAAATTHLGLGFDGQMHFQHSQPRDNPQRLALAVDLEGTVSRWVPRAAAV